MGKRLFWVDNDAIHNGPDHEGYWLIDGGGWEATELQAIADAYQATLDEAPYLNTGGVPRLLRTEAPELAALLDALAKEER